MTADVTEQPRELSTGMWRVPVPFPGHTPGHCCFFDATTGSLFTGDHVFPRIMANATYRPQSPPNPMQDYLASLDRLDGLPVEKVLPGHQEPFVGLGERLDVLRSYHTRRMEALC